MRRTILLAIAAAAALMAITAPASAATRVRPCPSKPEFGCVTLWVPLDRSGVVPGTLALRVERLTSRRKPHRGALVVLSGGPGQQGIFDSDGEWESYLADLAPGWDIVSIDQRGTGQSAPLRCQSLEEGDGGDDQFASEAAAARGCAAALGASGAFYSTADSVADLETLRLALGEKKLALYGTSYGTYVAQAYAAAHPDRVSRLVLDSVVDPASNDGFQLDMLEAVPRVLRALCAGRACAGVTTDVVRDVATLSARLATEPLVGTTVTTFGQRRTASFGGPAHPTALLDVLAAGDFDPLRRAAFPAAVRAALAGDADPFLRLVRPTQFDGFEPFQLSVSLFVATTCADTRLPWSAEQSEGERLAALDAAAARIPAKRFGPFPATLATRNETFGFCLGWPFAAHPPATDPQPDVPVLVLNGLDDLRTPAAEARRVAARYPHATLVLVPGQGHSVLGVARCTDAAMRRFMTGRPVRKPCRKAPERPAVLRVPPRSLAAVPAPPGTAGTRGRTFNAVQQTIADIDTALALSPGLNAEGLILTGLRGGSGALSFGAETLIARLRGYSFVPGVELHGTVRYGRHTTATLRIGGKAAARGVLELHGDGSWSGRLGGRPFSYR